MNFGLSLFLFPTGGEMAALLLRNIVEQAIGVRL